MTGVASLQLFDPFSRMAPNCQECSDKTHYDAMLKRVAARVWCEIGLAQSKAQVQSRTTLDHLHGRLTRRDT
jgi:hypothetical protein